MNDYLCAHRKEPLPFSRKSLFAFAGSEQRFVDLQGIGPKLLKQRNQKGPAMLRFFFKALIPICFEKSFC